MSDPHERPQCDGEGGMPPMSYGGAMRCILLATVALALATPTIAEDWPPMTEPALPPNGELSKPATPRRFEYLPPVEFDRPYTAGTLVVERLDEEGIRRECPLPEWRLVMA